MAGGRAAAKVALKGIAKPLEQLLKECEEVLAKDIAAAGRKAATTSTRDAAESYAERVARQEAAKLAQQAGTSTSRKWSTRARELFGDPPSFMTNPHGHHIAFQKGSNAASEYASKSREILQRFGIDPIHGKENLIWAENSGHSAANAREVLQRLTAAANSGGGRQAVEDALRKAGRQIFDGWP
jgi:N-acetyl-beta-hexosaminidase